LEKLNKKMQENWLEKVEYDFKGRLIMGPNFLNYKENVTTLREVVERHFNTVMKEIMNGLPSISNVEEDDNDYTFDGANVGKNWTCRICQVKNPIALADCTTCKTAKPDLTFMAGNRKQVGSNKK